MMIHKYLLIGIFALSSATLWAQDKSDSWEFEKEYFVGSQAFMLLTPLVDPSPEYYQLNFGYRFSPKDEVSIEGITWTYP